MFFKNDLFDIEFFVFEFCKYCFNTLDEILIVHEFFSLLDSKTVEHNFHLFRQAMMKIQKLSCSIIYS